MKNLQANYVSALETVQNLKAKYGSTWGEINPEHAARMLIQNRFKTGLDIAKYTTAIMRADMAAYDADNTQYTQSLGAWHGFVAQQTMIAVKKHHKNNEKKIHLSFRLDGSRIAFGIWSFTGSIHARKNSCS